MSKHSESIKFAAGVISIMAAAYFLNWLWMMLGNFGVVWSPYTCLTDPLGKTSDPAGFRFLVSQTTCSGIGKGPTEVSVFASKTGLMRRRTLIFKYESMADDSRDAEPVIVPSVDGTVRISVKAPAGRLWPSLTTSAASSISPAVRGLNAPTTRLPYGILHMADLRPFGPQQASRFEPDHRVLHSPWIRTGPEWTVRQPTQTLRGR